MKLKVLTEAGLELLEHNIPANIKHYQGAGNQWIYDFLEEAYIRDFQTEVADFELKVNKKEAAKADVENVKTLYSNLRFYGEFDDVVEIKRALTKSTVYIPRLKAKYFEFIK